MTSLAAIRGAVVVAVGGAAVLLLTTHRSGRATSRREGGRMVLRMVLLGAVGSAVGFTLLGVLAA